MSPVHASSGESRPTFETDACARSLADLAAALAPEADPVHAARTILAPLMGATGAARGSLMLADESDDCLRVVAGVGIPEGVIGQPLRSRPRSISHWVFRHGRGVVLQGVVRDPRFEASASADHIEASLSLPLAGARGRIGVVNLARFSPAPPFTDEDLPAIATAIAPIGAALEHLQRLRFGEDCVRQLREPEPGAAMTMVPAGLSEIRAWEIGCARRSAARPGSDVFDRLALPGGTHALLAADVPGAGPAAAMIAGFLRGLFAALAGHETSTAALAGRLHTELRAGAGSGRPVLLWVGRLSPKGEISSCCAGYPPPLWVPGDDGPVRPLATGGPPAGVDAGAAYEEERFRVLPGDLLAFVSHGVIEARDATDHALGLPRLAEIIGDGRHQPLDRLADAVLHAAGEHGGREVPASDQTALVLRFTPER